MADDAAYLTEKSGANGCVSQEETISMKDGKQESKGKQLAMAFKAQKGKPDGGVSLQIDHDNGVEQATVQDGGKVDRGLLC